MMAPAAAAPHEQADEPLECANCSSTTGLLRCSRCRTAFFCSLKCHRAYWPVHRVFCRKNDFADALGEREPRFAAWMRQHHKQAVLKDDEVDRLERAAHAASGTASRQEVMESMYGKADPRPAAPSYTPEQMVAMHQRREQAKQQAALMTAQDAAWAALPSPQPGFGAALRRYRWLQTLSHVEVHVRLPRKVAAAQVSVHLQPRELEVQFCGRRFIGGTLFHAIEPAGSTWFIDTGVLQLWLLKRCRKGRYWAGAQELELGQQALPRLPAGAPPLPIAPSAQSAPASHGTPHGSSNSDSMGGESATAVAGAAAAATAGAEDGAVGAAATPQPMVPRRKVVTAADTYWRGLFQDELLPNVHPPTAYFFADAEEEGGAA